MRVESGASHPWPQKMKGSFGGTMNNTTVIASGLWR